MPDHSAGAFAFVHINDAGVHHLQTTAALTPSPVVLLLATGRWMSQTAADDVRGSIESERVRSAVDRGHFLRESCPLETYMTHGALYFWPGRSPDSNEHRGHCN